MPYKIVKSGEKFKIVKKTTGEVVGTSATREKALSSINARLAGEHGWRPKKRKGKV